ncbi:hypothetical protein cce_2851 [Crocosphaera subtropica ATCC 51142]|uniref:CopG-like ribbon-helix-helix domain-containing protein n=1 Tax=Crocosphaera subtropica (strain ATCC 51142 / BH68) TaxID=43989 RepID=B1WV02_CROS5|nr:hypothetical protein [Crocosphaera subtropica]ACB52199.1 hypothetical protein cce_2851 [Crocosphaera subtropica ATCC 51142]
MATLNLNHIPDDMMSQIQQLAQQNHQSVDAQAVFLLKQALQAQNIILNSQKENEKNIDPENDPIWDLGKHPVEDTITDASVNLDDYLYHSL